MTIGSGIRDLLNSFKGDDIEKVPRAYLFQSIELVSTCRMIAQAASEKQDGGIAYNDTKLQELLQDTVKAMWSRVPKAYEDAEAKLLNYHDENAKELRNVINQRMQEARIKDAAIMKWKVGVLQSYTQKRLAKSELEKLDLKVWFDDMKSTGGGVGVIRSLSRNSNLGFVLWLLITEGRVTLEQNPHFYDDLSQAEQETFTTQALPLEREIATFARNPRVHILVDRKHHIRVKYAGGEKMYGNVWETTKKKIVLKEIDGKLITAEEARKDMRLEHQVMISSDDPCSVVRLSDWTEELIKIARNPWGFSNYCIEPMIEPPHIVPATASAFAQTPVTVVEQPVVPAATSFSSRAPMTIVENPVASTSLPHVHQIFKQFKENPVASTSTAVPAQTQLQLSRLPHRIL